MMIDEEIWLLVMPSPSLLHIGKEGGFLLFFALNKQYSLLPFKPCKRKEGVWVSFVICALRS